MYSIGLDFGTNSCRAVAINTSSGELCGVSVCEYKHGVITEHLPNFSDIKLNNNWALQSANDYLDSMQQAINNLLKENNLAKEQICGIGIDFTSCTLLPVDENFEPLENNPNLKNNPHAYTKLWKHHAAQNQADRITQIAKEELPEMLNIYGGVISSEWLISKGLQVLEESPEIYNATQYFIEAADWVAYKLTGNFARNSCMAGYKGLYYLSKKEANNQELIYPNKNFLKKLNPNFENFYEEKICGEVVSSGSFLGNLTTEYAHKLGLTEQTKISVPIIDAHAAMLGVGISTPKKLMIIMGTSACHLLIDENFKSVNGISGIVKDGIIKGFYAYEAGQAGFGDIINWFVNNLVSSEYFNIATQNNISIYQLLEQKASALNSSGLVMLDWLNGVRTPLVDSALSGMIAGLTLNTKPEHIYLAILESICFGSKIILEVFEKAGIEIEEIICCGGLASKNKLLLQLLSDITNKSITINLTEQASALGAAILGAMAADIGSSDKDIEAITKAMCSKNSYTIFPIKENVVLYENIFNEYKNLFHYFSEQNLVLKKL